MAYAQTTGTKFTLSNLSWIPIGAAIYGYYSNSGMSNRVSAAQQIGFNILRFINFLPSQIGSSVTTASQNETYWSVIDYGLEACRSAGIKVLLDLSDFQGILDARSYTWNSQAQTDAWKTFTDWLLDRVNTVNGRVYKNDDTIAIFSIVGEVGETGGSSLRSTFSTISANIKAKDSNHIIHTGGLKPEQIVDSSYGYQNYTGLDILGISSIDCASTHPYYTQQNMRDLFPSIQSYSISKNKPWFCEEFGYCCEHDNIRAAKYKFVFNESFKWGSAGSLVWNFDEGGSDGFGYSGFDISLTNTPEVFRVISSFTRSKQRSLRMKIY